MKNRIIILVLGHALALGAHFPLAKVEGIAVHIGFAAMIVGMILFIGALSGLLTRSDRSLPLWAAKLAVLAVALGFALLLAEIALNVFQKHGPTDLKAEMPKELAFRRVPGTKWDFYAHGMLHSHNASGFRDKPFTTREPGVMRIVALGDSLTFGQGIVVEERYSNLIGDQLGQNYHVEMLNLGKCGHQSEDILRVAKATIPVLQPDLVLYGHCLNDFLPSMMGQYSNNMRGQVPLPPIWKYAVSRTLVGKLLADRYNDLLMHLGIRWDFFGDILKGFEGYTVRFGHDVLALNQYVTSLGLPPVVALVLTQDPRNERGRRIAKIAEQKMLAAGMILAPSDYIEKFADKDVQLHVSKWEGHPNAFANQIFAYAFLQRLTAPDLAPLFERYRKTNPAASSPGAQPNTSEANK